MGKCKFRSDWLLKTDNNGDVISSWASLNEAEAVCKLCACNVEYENKGFHAFLQHADSAKHKKAASNMTKQMILVPNGTNSSQLNQTGEKSVNKSTNPAQIKLYSSRNAATVSELIWVMKSVCCNFSAASCQGIKDTFDAMFVGGVPKEFSLSPKKMNYLITDALAPYFRDLLIEDIGSSFFTICFDETTNAEDKKELQIALRYWSDNKGEVVTKHLQTYFLGKADAQILFKKICCAIKEAKLSVSKLLMIGSDGPNVNKKVHRLFDESLDEIRSFGLVDIGTCPIHIVHNAYLKSLEAFGEDASQLVVAIYHYFDGWPARWEEFSKIQEELKLPPKKFLKHSPSRWLTFRCAAERLLQQWEGIMHYFQKFVPLKKNQAVSQSVSFRKISELIRTQDIKAQIYLTISSAELYTTFTESFQKDEPLVHILFIKLQELIEKLARRVCREVSEDNYDNLFDSSNILPFKDIVVPQEVKEELKHLSEKDAMVFMKEVKNHYVAGCSYLIEKAFNNLGIAEHLKFLNPSLVINKRSCKELNFVAGKLPVKVKIDHLMDEFKLLQSEPDIVMQPQPGPGRIDHYWQNIFNIENAAKEKKYTELPKVVKVLLSLSHGNANVERRFSESKWALTEQKASTTERTFNAIMIVKDALKHYENKPELVPMTSKLISMGQNAHKQYTLYMEEQKRLKEIETKKKEEEIRLAAEEKKKLEKAKESKKKIDEIENKISQSKKEHEIAAKASYQLFQEANNRLKKAIQKGDLSEASIAQGMLEGSITMRQTEKEKLKEVENLQKNVEKRKNNLITTFFSKKPKKS